MNKKIHSTSARKSYENGFSLIELLVSMGIGLIVTLAITTVLTNSQGLQRTSTGLNDAAQTGAHAAFTLDRAGRSAGSGFTQFRQAMGCVLNAATTAPAKTLLPANAALPAPFSNIGTAGLVTIVLAPAVIIDGGGANGSDQLVFMTGNHGFSETAKAISPTSAKFASVVVDNSMGLQTNDLVLVADNVAGSGCMLQQLGAPNAQLLSMAGDYFQSVGATRALASFAGSQVAAVLPIGWMNPVVTSPSNPPAFMVYGIGANETLFGYDLLNTTGNTPMQLAEGVVSLHALYGTGPATIPLSEVSATNPQVPPTPLAWAPATGALSANTLWAGAAPNSPAAVAVRNTIQTIKAVRIAMVLRSAVEEKAPIPPAPPVSPNQLILFPDLPTAQQVVVPLSASEQNFRHRVIETIIPIRNL